MRSLLIVAALTATAALADEAPVGEVRSCLDLARIDATRVLDDRTILFKLYGGDVYKVDLGRRCPQLGFERSFSYATSLSQLCKQDIIHVLVDGGHQQGAACGLADFVKVDPALYKIKRAEWKAQQSAEPATP